MGLGGCEIGARFGAGGAQNGLKMVFIGGINLRARARRQIIKKQLKAAIVILIFGLRYEMVREKGLEPLHQRRKNLNLVRLPISPLPQGATKVINWGG